MTYQRQTVRLFVEMSGKKLTSSTASSIYMTYQNIMELLVIGITKEGSLGLFFPEWRLDVKLQLSITSSSLLVLELYVLLIRFFCEF